MERELSLEEKMDLMIRLKNTDFWNKLLVPEFKAFLQMMEESTLTEEDPWKRYGGVQAIYVLRGFKMYLEDIIETNRTSPKNRIEIGEGGVPIVEGSYPKY
jgi:hypothetical protein